MKKKIISLIIMAAVILSLIACGKKSEPEPETASAPEIIPVVEEKVFPDWNPDAKALQFLIEYVEDVTNDSSVNYIPVEDRLAVFDLDGTLYAELCPTYLEYYMLAWRILKDSSYFPDAQQLAFGQELRESVLRNSFSVDFPLRQAYAQARAYAGMTLTEFADWTREILLRDVDGFVGMTYGEAFYLPMLEVIKYLQDNGFEIYVISEGDRFICRTLLEGYVDIPSENIIGMDVAVEASGQNGADGLDYVFQAGDQLIRTDRLQIKTMKMNKVAQIARDIGRQPVLSFGNSSGDVSMHMYTISNNPYRSAAFMLLADDEERDYGKAYQSNALRRDWEARDFHVISMQRDFRTIYGDHVKKTGSFRWEEELRDDR